MEPKFKPGNHVAMGQVEVDIQRIIHLDNIPHYSVGWDAGRGYHVCAIPCELLDQVATTL